LEGCCAPLGKVSSPGKFERNHAPSDDVQHPSLPLLRNGRKIIAEKRCGKFREDFD